MRDFTPATTAPSRILRIHLTSLNVLNNILVSCVLEILLAAQHGAGEGLGEARVGRRRGDDGGHWGG